MRSSVPTQAAQRGRALAWLSPVVALALFGCPKQDLAPLGPCTVSAVSERVDQSGVSDVDMLFVIDNSGSMASEQLKLAEQLPRLVQVLTEGDRYAGLDPADYPPEDPENPRMFTAVKTLHLGVVSTNMGGVTDASGQTQAAIISCLDHGDDGKLQNSTEVAADGVYAVGNREFDGYTDGEEVLPPDSECASIGRLPLYQVYDANEGDSPADTSRAFGCVATLGVRGCPFEQQLEAMWKALAPNEGLEADDIYTFMDGSKGQGDNANEGFLRPDAILAVIVVSDEEDCSITDDGKELFGLDTAAKDKWGDLNLRCGINAEETSLIHPVERYVDGLRSLKADNPDRLIYAAIVGVPVEALGESIEKILDRPEMMFAPNPDKAGFPMISCRSSQGDEAYPPRRMLQVAQGFPDNSVIYSICADDYSPALDTLIQKIASKLKGNCLPRQLSPGTNGLVACEVYELLPKGETECDERYGLEGDPIDRNIDNNGKNEARKACKMKQLAVITSGDGSKDHEQGAGWYYDNFSPSLAEDCNPGELQRISFAFGDLGTDLPSGAGATFECFQPVARIDNDARGFDAVNSRCEGENGQADQATCSGKSTEDYELLCLEGALTCQIACDSNPDCPPGWVCDTGNNGEDDGPSYCQLPTCPQDNPASSN